MKTYNIEDVVVYKIGNVVVDTATKFSVSILGNDNKPYTVGSEAAVLLCEFYNAGGVKIEGANYEIPFLESNFNNGYNAGELISYLCSADVLNLKLK